MTGRRIAFVVGSLWFGGAEKHVVALANLLPADKFEAHLLYLEAKTDLLAQVRPGLLGQAVCLNKRSRFDAGLLLRLRRQLVEIRPEIVVCVNGYSLFLVDLVRWSVPGKPKLVVLEHSTILTGWHERLFRLWLRRTMDNRCASAVFVSELQFLFWRERYGLGSDNAVVIHNGVDSERYAPRLSSLDRAIVRNRWGLGHDDFVIACCAGLRPEKCHLDLLEAVRRLKARGHVAKVLLIGDGSERSRIQQWLRDHGLEDQCILAGFQSDVRPCLEACDVVVLTSRTEGFPMAILEAMSLGRVVIAPAVGGIPEQIQDGRTGFIFPVGDVDALSKVLAHLMETGLASTMGNLARQRVLDRFSEAQMVTKYAALFESL